MYRTATVPRPARRRCQPGSTGTARRRRRRRRRPPINPNNGPETGGTTVVRRRDRVHGGDRGHDRREPVHQLSRCWPTLAVACITPPGLVSPPARAVVVQLPERQRHPARRVHLRGGALNGADPGRRPGRAAAAQACRRPPAARRLSRRARPSRSTTLTRRVSCSRRCIAMTRPPAPPMSGTSRSAAQTDPLAGPEPSAGPFQDRGGAGRPRGPPGRRSRGPGPASSGPGRPGRAPGPYRPGRARRGDRASPARPGPPAANGINGGPGPARTCRPAGGDRPRRGHRHRKARKATTAR